MTQPIIPKLRDEEELNLNLGYLKQWQVNRSRRIQAQEDKKFFEELIDEFEMLIYGRIMSGVPHDDICDLVNTDFRILKQKLKEKMGE